MGRSILSKVACGREREWKMEMEASEVEVEVGAWRFLVLRLSVSNGASKTITVVGCALK